MRLALLPGLLLAVTLAIFAQGATNIQAAAISGSHGGTQTLFSVLAQTTPTTTVTTGAGATVTATGTTGAGATVTTTGTTAAATVTGAVTTAAGTVTGTTTVEATVTETAEVTSTAVVSPTVTPATVPLSGQGGGGLNLQLNPFDWNFLTSPAPAWSPGPFALLYFILMLGLLGFSGYIYFVRRPKWKGTNTPYFKAANRWAPIFMWIAGLGLLFWLLRLVSIDFFNLRIWLYLFMLIAVGFGAWYIYWSRTALPKEVARFQKTQRARQYMPGSAKPRTATGPSTPVTTTGTAQRPAGTTQRTSSGRRRKKK